MRKAIILAVTMALALAGAAYAATYDGSRHSDRFVGTSQGDRAVMRAGNDYANGKANADFLFGNDGRDLLNGGDGNDLIVGGDEDELVGSRGDDTIYTGAEADGDKESDEVVRRWLRRSVPQWWRPLLAQPPGWQVRGVDQLLAGVSQYPSRGRG